MVDAGSPNAAAFAACGLAWRAWSADTIAAASAAEQPLMLVVITATDHWSARLARELAADAEAREFLATALVPVLVDRDEEPAVAARAQQLLALNQAQGHPAIVFCLPDGRAVGAIPWAPLRDRDKRAGLLRVAHDVVAAWREQPGDLHADAETMAGLLAQLGALGDERGLPAAALALDAAEAALLAAGDELEGGFGAPPRFLQPAILDFLLRRTPDGPPSVGAQLARSIDALLAGATWDHLSAGLAHAATDGGFHRVLAERRLLDQAQLAVLLLQGAGVCERPHWRLAARALVDWSFQAFAGADGWAAGLHADGVDAAGAPVDGAWYAWSEDAAAEVVGREGAALFARRYLADEAQAVDDAGDWRIPALRGAVSDEERERLPALCRRLAVARAQRPPPARDERVLPLVEGSWLRALALSVAAFGDEPEAADQRAAATALAARLAASAPSTLAGEALAWVGRGLAAWARTTSDDAALAAARRCGEELRRRHPPGTPPALADDPHWGRIVEATDAPDRPALAAVIGACWLDLAEGAEGAEAAEAAAWTGAVDELLVAHAGLLRVAPASAAGLCALWQRRRRAIV